MVAESERSRVQKKVLFATNMLIHLIFYTLFHLRTKNTNNKNENINNCSQWGDFLRKVFRTSIQRCLSNRSSYHTINNSTCVF